MSATRSNIQHIPLGKLSVSLANVRRTERKADVEALAASIAAHGLLQNLTVTAAENECFAGFPISSVSATPRTSPTPSPFPPGRDVAQGENRFPARKAALSPRDRADFGTHHFLLARCPSMTGRLLRRRGRRPRPRTTGSKGEVP